MVLMMVSTPPMVLASHRWSKMEGVYGAGKVSQGVREGWGGGGGYMRKKVGGQDKW